MSSTSVRTVSHPCCCDCAQTNRLKQLFVSQKARPTLHFFVNLADVFAHEAEEYNLHAAEKVNRNHGAGPAGRRVTHEFFVRVKERHRATKKENQRPRTCDQSK